MGNTIYNASSFSSVLDYLPPGDSSMSLRARVHKSRDVASDYIINPRNVIGNGLNGDVVTCKSRQSDREFALKVFMKRENSIDFRNEVLIFLEMDHPNIARLYNVYETKHKMSLVMEYCRGGELYDRLVTSRHFPEVNAQRVTRQMLLAVSYVHNKNIVHRDLKLENFLYSDCSENATLKLIDFGFSNRWTNHAVTMKKGCGSLMYVAPEVIKKSYTSKCDIWSLGVIVYVLIAGTAPFWGKTQKETLHHISTRDIITTGGNWDTVSPVAKNFVRSLLCRNPAIRPTALQALEMPWLVQNHECTLGLEVLTGLMDFAEAEKFKRAALRMLAWIVRAPERKKVEHLFLALDKGNQGYVKLGEFQEALQKEFDVSPSEATWLFEAISDGTRLYYTDFLAAMVNHRIEMSEEIVTDAFSRFDSSNTGYISSKDLTNILGETFEHENVDEMVQSLTSDPRGISYNLFVDVLKGKNRSGKPKYQKRSILDLPSSCSTLLRCASYKNSDDVSTIESLSSRTFDDHSAESEVFTATDSISDSESSARTLTMAL